MDVLVVEDEDSLRESLIDGLSGAFPGLEIAGAGSAEQAESLLESDLPQLIISDVRLPGKDGVDFLFSVRTRWPGAQFIFMSAYPSPKAQTASRDRGIHFLSKPFEFSDLLKAAEPILDQSHFSGSLGGVSLIDLLQLLNMSRRTAAVTVKHRGEVGTIFFRDGEVVHAVVGELEGREAFERLIVWRGGSFGSEPERQPPVVTIDEPFNSILLDTIRTHDEEMGTSDSDEMDDGLFALDEVPEDSSASFEQALRVIPDCVSAACVDIEAGMLIGLAPADSVPEAIVALIPAATTALFHNESLAALSAALGNASGAESAHPREILALSDDLIHFYQGSRKSRDRVFVSVCRKSANLGTVLTKARAWFRAQEDADTP